MITFFLFDPAKYGGNFAEITAAHYLEVAPTTIELTTEANRFFRSSLLRFDFLPMAHNEDSLVLLLEGSSGKQDLFFLEPEKVAALLGRIALVAQSRIPFQQQALPVLDQLTSLIASAAENHWLIFYQTQLPEFETE